MISTFSNISTAPVQPYSATASQAEQPEPSKSCGYWLRQIFCCGGCRKKKELTPQIPPAPRLGSMKKDRYVPPLTMEASQTALSLFGAMPAAASATALSLAALEREIPPVLLVVPDASSSASSAHIQVSAFASPAAASGEMKAARASRSILGTLNGDQQQSPVFGLLSMLQARNT